MEQTKKLTNTGVIVLFTDHTEENVTCSDDVALMPSKEADSEGLGSPGVS